MPQFIEAKTININEDADISRTTEIRGGLEKSPSDDAYLARLGKRPLLSRSFGFMSILGFSCSVLLSWEGILVTSVTSLINGGPAGAVWSFLINWVGTISVNAVLGELASMAPTAAGQCKQTCVINASQFTQRTWTAMAHY